ncbi:ty3-gypsy retrotransposon protein [Striga asiatica]|uniref:Ty3-gypsy retrotransposon protein n=1 Tax=Striga asiatica TaxID=4170 RepID=A0A5A7QZJ7_STRAF|nr:ty3-gypsy retrotransposon protein [Striga asiatica]
MAAATISVSFAGCIAGGNRTKTTNFSAVNSGAFGNTRQLTLRSKTQSPLRIHAKYKEFIHVGLYLSFFLLVILQSIHLVNNKTLPFVSSFCFLVLFSNKLVRPAVRGMIRMESRVETLEKSQVAVGEELTNLRNNMDSRFNALETAISKITDLLSNNSSSNNNFLNIFSESNTSNHHKSALHANVFDELKSTSKHIDLPCFDGTDPIGWIARAEQFFLVHHTKENFKVASAFICMHGRSSTPLASMAPATISNDYLASIEGRTRSLDDYANEFRARVAQVLGLDSQLQLGFFLNGLKEEIRVRLRPYDVLDLRTTMKVARPINPSRFEPPKLNNTSTIGPNKNSAAQYKPNDHFRLLQGGTGSSSSQILRHNTTTQKSRVARQYSHQEYLDMRAKGLCFCCKQPYNPMHDCPQKSLRALIAAEDENTDVMSDFGLEESQQLQAEINEAQLHFLDLPLTAIGGIDGPRTMKFSGHVYGEPVTIMVDSGASHNFISTKLAQKIPQPIEQTVRFGVRLGDGSRATSTGKYSNLPIQLQSIMMSLDCYIFPLGGIDIILGVAWLQTLGDIKANLTKMSIEFLQDNEEICLLGDPSLSRAPISLSSLQQMDDDIEYGLLLWQITSSTETSSTETSALKSSSAQVQELELILQQYCTIFDEPQGLPPERRHDHRITIKLGTAQ